jgi:hypothetical protein
MGTSTGRGVGIPVILRCSLQWMILPMHCSVWCVLLCCTYNALASYITQQFRPIQHLSDP